MERGSARPGLARLGWARRGKAWTTARLGRAWCGLARRGTVRLGAARQGMDHGAARLGVARQCVAWHGGAGLGKARQGILGMSDPGYIYIRGWAKFQHPDVARGGGARLPWIRDYVDQLDNEAYLSLSMSQRAALQDVRRLCARCGNGRVNARYSYIEGTLGWPPRYAARTLERLVQAGFIEIRASKAQATRKQRASTRGEEKRGSIKTKNARKAKVVADTNGNHPENEQPLSRKERQRAAQDALARLSAQQVKEV